jgi:hypothetical protein
MRGRASDLLRLPVRVNGIRVGHPEDVLFDRDTTRAVGIDVACGDGVVRFLPISGARVDGGALIVESPFLLVDHEQRSFYRRRTRTLSALRGAHVTRGRRRLGRLDDLELADGGAVAALVLDGGERVEAGDSVVVRAEDADAAA